MGINKILIIAGALAVLAGCGAGNNHARLEEVRTVTDDTKRNGDYRRLRNSGPEAYMNGIPEYPFASPVRIPAGQQAFTSLGCVRRFGTVPLWLDLTQVVEDAASNTVPTWLLIGIAETQLAMSAGHRAPTQRKGMCFNTIDSLGQRVRILPYEPKATPVNRTITAGAFPVTARLMAYMWKHDEAFMRTLRYLPRACAQVGPPTDREHYSGATFNSRCLDGINRNVAATIYVGARYLQRQIGTDVDLQDPGLVDVQFKAVTELMCGMDSTDLDHTDHPHCQRAVRRMFERAEHILKHWDTQSP